MTGPDALFESVQDTAAAVPSVACRDRILLVADATVFGPDADGFMAYLTAAAADVLRSATGRAAPSETFGVLLGRTFRDARGTYTLVASAVESTDHDASPGQVRLSATQMGELRRRAQLEHPAHDLVGWWHSHPWDSHYSRTDHDEQATWPDPHHVGVLTFMHGDPWARAYRGPRARPLDMAEPDGLAGGPVEWAGTQGVAGRWRRVGHGAFRLLRRGAPVWALLLLAAVTAGAVLALGMRIGQVETPPPAPASAPTSPPQSPQPSPAAKAASGPSE